MQRVASFILIALFLALGTRAIEFAHNRQHTREIEMNSLRGSHRDSTPQRHDDSNCLTHATLRAPLLSSGWVPVLVCLGLFVAFLTLLPHSLESHLRITCIDCRGPPSC